jgi:hypothetical protein
MPPANASAIVEADGYVVDAPEPVASPAKTAPKAARARPAPVSAALPVVEGKRERKKPEVFAPDTTKKQVAGPTRPVRGAIAV